MAATSALETVGQYITESRRLLQDQFVPYRYPDADIVDALNFGLLEARRLRPDLFLANKFDVPWVNPDGTIVLDTKVPLDKMYRSSMTYYIAGRLQLRDDEATTDSRAAGFMNKFMQQLLVVAS